MPVKVPAHMHPLKYNGIFDFDSVYRAIHEWLNISGYFVQEPLHKRKVPTTAGAELDIYITGWRKVDAYVRYWIYVYIKAYDLKEVEVVKEGKKKKLVKARILIEMSGDVELDYNNYFEKTRFLRALRDLLNTIVLKHRIDDVWWDELYYRMLKLHRIIKEKLDMEIKTNAYHDVW